jgi:spermidine synthase
VGFASSIALLKRYAGRKQDLGLWLEGAEINRDRNLRLQYLAGMASSLYEERSIYDSMLSHRKYPEELFRGSEENREILRQLPW